MPEKLLVPARHEPTDVGARFIWIGVALLLAQYPNPQLQPSPSKDMAKFYAEEMRWLNSTGWVDKTRAIVHIPIADAMTKVVQEGIPGWPTPQEKRP